MLPHFSLGELIVLLFVVLLIFGPKRLPELGSSLGKSIRSFKEGLREEEGERSKSQTSKPTSDKSS